MTPIDRSETTHGSRDPTRTISLDEFEFHEGDESSPEPKVACYTHACRCSHELVITEKDLEEGVDMIECMGCGERIGVGYQEAVDES